jgi:hypothetical protein
MAENIIFSGVKKLGPTYQKQLFEYCATEGIDDLTSHERSATCCNHEEAHGTPQND